MQIIASVVSNASSYYIVVSENDGVTRVRKIVYNSSLGWVPDASRYFSSVFFFIFSYASN